ncbi:MAG TPA: choice-of-anchor V domain-containing protein [Longimicrobium sp.]
MPLLAGAIGFALAGGASIGRADHPGPAFPDGPPLARTGGFGEQTCHACHFDGEENAAGGSLTISGLPQGYVPGQTYRITIALQRGAMQAGGFQLAARVKDGPSAGKQAGTLRTTDDRVQVKAAPSGVQYASHTRPGIQLTTAGRVEWTVEWTAPDPAAGEVVFHAAGTSANKDDSPLGDFIYTTMQSSRPR